jgi:hypothetical protein
MAHLPAPEDPPPGSGDGQPVDAERNETAARETSGDGWEGAYW